MIQLYQTLDLRPIGIPQTLRLSQYDSDFEIIFELTNFDGTWILDTSTTAEVQGTKTDGHGYSADAVFDDQLKTVTIAGDVQMTAATGRNVFEVVLFHDGDRLGSKNFVLDVERAALDAETTASDSGGGGGGRCGIHFRNGYHPKDCWQGGRRAGGRTEAVFVGNR